MEAPLIYLLVTIVAYVILRLSWWIDIFNIWDNADYMESFFIALILSAGWPLSVPTACITICVTKYETHIYKFKKRITIYFKRKFNEKRSHF